MAKKTSKRPVKRVKPGPVAALERGIVHGLLAARLRRAQRGIYQHFEDWFRDVEMTPLQFSILNLIELNPTVNQKDMASFTLVERPSFGETLMRLKRKGLIERRRDPGDRRANLMRLTPLGRELLKRMIREVPRQELKWSARLTDRERTTLMRLLQKLTQEPPGKDPR